MHGPADQHSSVWLGRYTIIILRAHSRESLTCFQVFLLLFQLGFQQSHLVTGFASCNRGKLTCLPPLCLPQHFSTLMPLTPVSPGHHPLWPGCYMLCPLGSQPHPLFSWLHGGVLKHNLLRPLTPLLNPSRSSLYVLKVKPHS